MPRLRCSTIISVCGCVLTSLADLKIPGACVVITVHPSHPQHFDQIAVRFRLVALQITGSASDRTVLGMDGI